jgi:hypothetical protein
MTAKKTTKKTAKKAATKKAATKKTATKKATTKTGTKKAVAKKASPAKAKVTATDVNLGHVFALRPRVNASFAPERFRRAKDLLAGETYASIPEAARAVAEKALETSREVKPKRRR